MGEAMIGTRLGPYEITAKLGEGGGVYRSLAVSRTGPAWAIAFWLAAAAPLAAADVVIWRDGSRETGVLQSCAGDRCQWAGRSVPRSEIGWIGFAEGGAPPTPRDPIRDQVWLRDGQTAAGEVLGLSLGSVVTEEDSFDRPEVSWIYFGSAAGLPRQEIAAPADVSPAPRDTAKTPASVEAPTSPALAATPQTLYLNEVSVLPEEGGIAFVELGNDGPDPIPLAGVGLRNGRGTVCALPQDATVGASRLYLILFDGASGGGVAHCPTGFLSKEDTVELRAASGRWDSLDWGETPFGLALRTRGGQISDTVPGTGFGRPPATLGVGASPWVRYSRPQVSPGKANPLPAVDNFMALAGGIFERREVPLTWYTVGGASRYRVQLSTTDDFSVLAFERSVETPRGRANEVARAITEPLTDGLYFWRVQALGAGVEAPFSEPRSFEVRAARAAGKAKASEPAAPSPDEELILPVPYIEQHKDTSLLALEADSETDPDPWDRPWESQGPYCARASIAMVTAYYLAKLDLPGKLSQDRITYEAYHDRMREAGPEIDIYVDAGFNARMIQTALDYALGAPASKRFLVPPEALEKFNDTTGMFTWESVVKSLKEKRPVLGTSESHAWVYAGYRRTSSGQEFRIWIQP
jgi:hypothetical protein